MFKKQKKTRLFLLYDYVEWDIKFIAARALYTHWMQTMDNSKKNN